MSSDDPPIRLQACLNGDHDTGVHPMLPTSTRELASDAAACAAAGADSFHVHPRDASGRPTLDPEAVDAAVQAIRAATGKPVGVSTSQTIERDPARRAEQIGAWAEPDYASVNLAEDDAAAVMELLLDRGIDVEAGLSSPEDAQALVDSGLADRVTRVLVEPYDDDGPDAAFSSVGAIHDLLDTYGVGAPRLQHSDGEAAWPVLEDAVARGLATRIGLEDTQQLGNGRAASSNADLVRAAAARDAQR
ncbi:MAG: 3-keto-5-aminohexanoate cleavage protein [Patulibacter minatonensis]